MLLNEENIDILNSVYNRRKKETSLSVQQGSNYSKFNNSKVRTILP